MNYGYRADLGSFDQSSKSTSRWISNGGHLIAVVPEHGSAFIDTLMAGRA